MKYFVVSDIHSFYIELRKALRQAGYSKKNVNHTLIVCGDIFDRGPDAIKVYNFLHSIPKSRRILIRGNHEALYLKLLNKHYPEGYDFHNGTVDTFCQVANQYLYIDRPNDQYRMSDWLDEDGYGCCEETIQEKHSLWEDIRNTVEKSKITKWIKSKEWKNYFEIDKYIFVHSFIPTTLKQSIIDELGIYAYGSENPKCFEYDPDWRNRASVYWDDAIWGCPYAQYEAGLFKPEEDNGKTLVCGHWHTSDFFKHLKFIHTYTPGCGPIYFSKGLIGIDGGCRYDYYYGVYEHPQNVLVINDKSECYDNFGCKLIEPEEFQHKIIRTVTIDKDGNEILGSDDFLEK